MGKMEYREIQRFRQPWIWIILAAMWIMTVGVFGSGLYQQIWLGKPFGNSPMSDQALIVTFILTFLLVTGLNVLLATARLMIHIDKRLISYRFAPFHRDFRRIAWNNVREAEVVTYRPIRQYGGWGIRLGKEGKAFNVSGNKGLQLVMNNGERLLIGTSNEKELTAFLSGIFGFNQHGHIYR